MNRLRPVAALAGATLCILPSLSPAQNNNRPKVAWHWHMHQPIYWNAPRRAGAPDRYEYAMESIQQKRAGAINPENDLDEIFGKADRVNAYQWETRNSILSAAGDFPVGSENPNMGAVMSYSGALMKNVQSLGATGEFGYTSNWWQPIQQAITWDTARDQQPRMDLVNFSYHHALLALHNEETVYAEIRAHQEIVKQRFGTSALSRGFFPPEMAFSTRLIPVLDRLGIDWVIVSGEKIARATPDFPLQLGTGGVNCDPPNPADKRNPPGVNFIRETISRGCSPVNANPLSYQPAFVRHIDPDTGEEHRVIAIPADQSWSWNDGYNCINAGFLTALEAQNNPLVPSLALLSHDGDNAFGGGSSYYNECVPNLADGARNQGNEPTTIEQYLAQYEQNITNTIHVEDGAWVNADSDFGSPSFINWNYPLLDANGQLDPVNGWHEKPREMAIFTATLNRVLTATHLSGKTVETLNYAEIISDNPNGIANPVERAWHYHLGSLDSGNVYFGAPLDLEIKATIGANRAVQIADQIIDQHPADADTTPPTIWLPQRSHWNPGGLNFGVQYGYQPYHDDGDFHIWTFIHDVSGPVDAVLHYRIDNDGTIPLGATDNFTYAGGSEVGEWIDLPMAQRAFPSGNIYNKGELNYTVLPTYIADHHVAEVTGLGEVLIDYYVEATDAHGNVSRSPIQHVWIGDGESATTPGGDRVTLAPEVPTPCEEVTITYDASGGPLADQSQVLMHFGINNWDTVLVPDQPMTNVGENLWQITRTVPGTATQLDMAFNNGGGIWDSNGGADWNFATDGAVNPDCGEDPGTGPLPNPFAMNGTLDPNTCEVPGGLHLAVKDGWLYVAAEVAGHDDVFIYVSSGDAGALQPANWSKSGQVAAWDWFLAREGTNNFINWFDASQGQPPADATNRAFARSGTFMEGAIRLSHMGPGPYHVAMGVYGTDNDGTLVAQSPTSDSPDENIDPFELHPLGPASNPCSPVIPSPGSWIRIE